MKWADGRLLAAVPVGSFAQLLAILNHIYRAEAVWLSRVLGQPGAQLAHIADAESVDVLRQLWPPVNQGWLDWAALLTDDAASTQMVPHRDSRGNSHELPAWQIVMHVVNHGSYHRGQATRLMREAGITPPATDLVIYYRSQI
jgi:uncharacterized damage-inducible protein DinB